ncbi:MAG: hypothetical protein LW865_01925 [Betaproteobacteria bacterium]|jgi:hypothetical protein|nr:hypothetical protein [Betaproteobacteria bacterium]
MKFSVEDCWFKLTASGINERFADIVPAPDRVEAEAFLGGPVVVTTLDHDAQLLSLSANDSAHLAVNVAALHLTDRPVRGPAIILVGTYRWRDIPSNDQT